MKVLVTGDREWTKLLVIFVAFLDFLKEHNLSPEDITVIHGDCRGADKMAAMVAKEMGMKPKPYPAHWRHTKNCPPNCRKMQGPAAGPIRNQQMIDENPDLKYAFAFHPDLDNSKGTKDMVKKLKKAKIPYIHLV